MEENLLDYAGSWANPRLGTMDRAGRIQVMLHWKNQGLSNRQISNKINCGQVTVANHIGPDVTTPMEYYDIKANRLINKLTSKHFKNRRKKWA